MSFEPIDAKLLTCIDVKQNQTKQFLFKRLISYRLINNKRWMQAIMFRELKWCICNKWLLSQFEFNRPEYEMDGKNQNITFLIALALIFS